MSQLMHKSRTYILGKVDNYIPTENEVQTSLLFLTAILSGWDLFQVGGMH